MKKRTALIFYVLSAYVVIQFIWWGYHLVELTDALADKEGKASRALGMVIGEGAVFLLILLLGIWQIRRSVQKELTLRRRQNNFLLSVTHELKTPLAANKLYLQTIKKRDLSGDQQTEILVKALQENERLERMIDNILNASRLENQVVTLTMSLMNVRAMVEQCAERQGLLSPDAKISIEIEENDSILADPLFVETIVNNLIENALKYSGKGAKVLIEGNQVKNHFVIKVTDNGPGVSAKDQSEIFKKFYRDGNEETRTQKGSGLGLFIVDQLTKLHGGSVSCRNVETSGAQFEITLPNES